MLVADSAGAENDKKKATTMVFEKGDLLRSKLGLITQEDLGLLLDVSVDTLREWRRLKQGPDFVRTGKGVMYREVDIKEWLERNVVPVVRCGG